MASIPASWMWQDTRGSALGSTWEHLSGMSSSTTQATVSTGSVVSMLSTSLRESSQMTACTWWRKAYHREMDFFRYAKYHLSRAQKVSIISLGLVIYFSICTNKSLNIVEMYIYFPGSAMYRMYGLRSTSNCLFPWLRGDGVKVLYSLLLYWFYILDSAGFCDFGFSENMNWKKTLCNSQDSNH